MVRQSQARPVTGKVPAVGNTVEVERDLHQQHRCGRTQEGMEGSRLRPRPGWVLITSVYCRYRPHAGPLMTQKIGSATPSWVSATVQERAWTSPIWYAPTEEESRNGEKRSVTVADLKQKGAEALDDAQLTRFVVGKTLMVRNTVTVRVLEFPTVIRDDA